MLKISRSGSNNLQVVVFCGNILAMSSEKTSYFNVVKHCFCSTLTKSHKTERFSLNCTHLNLGVLSWVFTACVSKYEVMCAMSISYSYFNIEEKFCFIRRSS
jgi:hypothetical protein